MSDRAAEAARLRQAVAANPGDRLAWHNLAAAEGDLGRAAAALDAASRAIGLGIPAPETRLVRARALQSLGRLDEAEGGFAEAIALRPGYVDAHRDLAQLVWMRRGDAAAALARVDAALKASSGEPGLHLVRSLVLEFAGDLPAALSAAQAGLVRAPGDFGLLRQAAHLCIDMGDAPRALALAQQAAIRAPAGSGAEAGVCEALLALGRVAEADAVAQALCGAQPRNQYALALQATAWRLAGDARYATLCDYDRLIGAQLLDTPAGWSSLGAFLADVATELHALHGFEAHPLQQSVRGGSQLHLQSQHLERPTIAALFRAIAAAVQRHLETVGSGADAFRTRNNGRFAFTGAWSVRLRSGGHHTDHVHPHGWLSSACYIALPEHLGAGDEDHAGWLRLGKPATATRPPLDAERHVRPEPGLLVLFPAYMWHGVEAFEAPQPRLSVAFDVIPA